MMNKFKIFPAVFVAVLFFSLFSGCKIKQKHQQKSTVKESSETKLSTQSSVQKKDSTASVKTDQSVLKSEETKKSTNTRSIKLTIDLDSNQTVVSDSMGNFSLNALVSSALKNARRIQIEAQEQQSTESNKVNSTALDKKEAETKVNQETSDSRKNLNKKQQKEEKKADTETVKDSTLKQNLSDTWTVIIAVVVILVICFFIYKLIRPAGNARDLH